MGCTASKPMILHAALNDWYPPVARSISMPTHAQDHMQGVDDFQIVPLSASKYGIMKVEAPNDDTVEDMKDLLQGDSMREALKRLENLDLGPDSGPQLWLEATSMLEDLKPGLEKYFSGVGGLMEVIQPGSGRKSTAHTPSEVDDGAEAVSKEDAAHFKGEKVSKKGTSSPLQGLDEYGRVGKENTKPYISSVGLSKDRCKDSQRSKGARSLSKLFSFVAHSKRGSRLTRDGKTGADVVACQSNLSENCANSSSEPRSSLFDAHFLASYEDALKKLNLDDWESLQSHALGADSITSKDWYETQALDTEWKSSDGRISEAQALKSSGVDDTSVPSKPTPVAKRTVKKKVDPLEKFEKICPPGGEKAVVFYTTSLRGVRKTFDDCSSVRAALQSFSVSVDERDISMHQDFRNELREMMGKPVRVPRLFIKGRYIGGAEEALQLHEDGQLVELLEGIPKDETNGRVCDGCGGLRFVPCLECSGSRKLVNDEEEVVRCPHCNENGLIQCPICSLLLTSLS